MENECEALPGFAYPGVRDNRSTINTKTGYDDDDDNPTNSIITPKDNQVKDQYYQARLTKRQRYSMV